MVVVGVLIAVVTAYATAVLVNVSRPAAASPSPLLTLAASATGNTVVVIGSGSGTAVPDQASVYLGVSATKPNVRDAVNSATNDMGKLLSAVRREGVADKDIQTATISINQQTNCCPQNVVGYTAAGQITVTLHSVQKVATLIEAAVDAVGNTLTLNGVNLSVADSSAALKSARQAAINDATAKAQDWARLTGHHIGGLVSVSEYFGAVSQPAYGKGGAGGGGFQVQPGEQSSFTTVLVTFDLLT
jgi:uncharacterized protein YggE